MPAWQSQDIAPTSSGISIPTDTVLNHDTAMNADDQNWSNGNRRSPVRDRNTGDKPHRRSSRSRSPGAPREGGRSGVKPGNNPHVSGLSHRVDTRDLEALFAKIGRIKKAAVMYDPYTRESRGFGFVTMESAEEADAAIAALNTTDFMGKISNVEKAYRGGARTRRYYGPPKRSDHRMTEVILVTMMTEEEAAAVVTTIIVVADGTMIAPEITAEETLTIVVMVEIGMMTGGARSFFSLAAAK